MSWVKKAKEQGIQRQIDRKPENVARRAREEQEALMDKWKKAAKEKDDQFRRLYKKAKKRIDGLNRDLSDGGLFVEDVLIDYFYGDSLTPCVPFVPETVTDSVWFDQGRYWFRDIGVLVSPESLSVYTGYSETAHLMAVWSVFVKDYVETKLLFTLRLCLVNSRYRNNPRELQMSITYDDQGRSKKIHCTVTNDGFMSGVGDLKIIKDEISLLLSKYWERRKLVP